jgi:2-aminoadipate transaminase
MHPPLALSAKAMRTTEQPISYFMKQALENPGLISLAAGLVDQESLPVAEARAALDQIMADAEQAKAALQYGTTEGLPELRERIWHHVARLDNKSPGAYGLDASDVVITTGSQQLLYLLNEVLFDPGDIVITEAPSYFVHHSVLTSHGVRVLSVPMDEQGMRIDALAALLERLAKAGELNRLKMIYTCDYYQNPSGLTLSPSRRRDLLELARKYSREHRLLILEDAAYRELGFEPRGLPSVKSFDDGNRHVIYAGTFSKPCAPGLKTGYALLPRDLVAPLLRAKGGHDFGSNNFAQSLIEQMMTDGAYDRHVAELREVYRTKCDAMLAALEEEFGDWPGASWTRPEGGMFVWLTLAGVDTGPNGKLLNAALEEGMLYVPGEFCHMPDEAGYIRRDEMRLCYGVEPPERLREAVRRLRRAVDSISDASEMRSALHASPMRR